MSGEPIRASGSTRSVGSLYTIAIHASGFLGRVYIEGTLAANPSAEDWFPIVMPGLETPYVEFPQKITEVRGFNFKGSFAWIRARMDRSYLGISPDYPAQQVSIDFGYIDKIILNMGTWSTDQTIPTTGPSFRSVESVQGGNVGSTGAGVYLDTIGQSDVLLRFKRFQQGEGIAITEDAESITITNTGSGSGDGGGSGVSQFKHLSDTPADITSRGVLVGTAFGTLNFVPPPTTNGQVLTNTTNGLVWQAPTIPSFGVEIRDENTVIVAATTKMNFVGSGVQVTNDGSGGAVVTIGESEGTVDPHLEFVLLQYTAGNSGNFNSGDRVISTSSGVTVTVVDAVNCIVQFTFTARNFPPSAIALMGQAFATNEFNFSNVNPSLATRTVQSGGTSASPTLMGSFTGPITLQLRMSDTGATAGAGQRAKAAIMFRF
jgi:hypothetical protein